MKEKKEKTYAFWSEISLSSNYSSTIDPNDTKGYKNKYIASLRNNVIFKKIKKYINDGDQVLDYGCGHGDLSEYLSIHELKVTGVDITENLINLANKREINNAVFLKYDGEKLPLKDNSVDFVVSYGVLIYLDDSYLREIIIEFKRICKNGSKLIFVEQARLKRKESISECKIQRSIKEWVGIFEKSGLAVKEKHIVRYGHNPILYLIRFGLIPKSLFKFIGKMEMILGRVLGRIPFDYYDVCFVCELDEFN